MSAILVAAGLAFTAVAVLVTLTVFAFAIKFVIKLILLPLLLIKWLVMGVVMLIVGPILFVAGLLAAAAVGLALALPLLPFLALGALIWIVVRATRPPVMA
jgi:hypothetical protein